MNWVARSAGNIVGPSAVIAAGTMGAGAVASLILAGAWFRYDLLWVILFMLPLFVISVDSASRIGFLNRDIGMLSIIRQHTHPGIAWLLLLINVPVHIFVAMGQFSVMTSAFLSLFGLHPPTAGSAQSYIDQYLWMEIGTSVFLAITILWLILSHGYERMQKAMTGFMVLMFFCFFIIALRSFGEIGAIATGFVPGIPADLPVPGQDTLRLSSSSIIAIVGSAIAPGALLAIPYMSSDAHVGSPDLKKELHKSIINLGVIFGAYAMFVLIAGGFALYPLANHAEIETVHEAGQVLSAAFPESIGFIGPFIFTLGLFIAALTTLVVAIQVVIYMSLDMLNRPWTFIHENHLYSRLLVALTLLSAVLAPLWSFPALLKVVLLMGFNVIVIPAVVGVLIYLLNRREVMQDYTAGWWRNSILVTCLLVSIVLATGKAPDYVHLLFG